MSMTYEQFMNFASHFEQISNTISDGWKIDRVIERDSEILYLRKANFSDGIEVRTKVLWEYNIIYSCSYNVPVLYFNACYDTGKLLSLENLKLFIDANFKDQFILNKWSLLTQQEHPFTRSPCFMLHPCRTEELVSNIKHSKINPLVTWLSSIAPIVNLKLDLPYGSTPFTFDKKSTVGKQSEIIMAVEMNTACNEVYEHNFPKTKVVNRNICSLSTEEINNLGIDLILMSPPCQPFTRLGKQKDLEDNRNISLLQFIEILSQLNSLSYILLENVKGFEKSETRKKLITALREAKFSFKEFLLNPRQFKICNSRLRYYLLAKRTSQEKNYTSDDITYEIPPEYENNLKTALGSRIPLKIEEVLQFKNTSNEWSLYSVSRENVDKYFSALDIVTAEDNNSCCFTRAYTRYLKGTGSLLTKLSRNDLTQFQLKFENDIYSGGNFQNNCVENSEILQLRYFTPKEVARLMTFPEQFDFPSNTTEKQKYKMLSNSINVHVVSFLISYLVECFPE